jgi:hypothetical protein
MDYYCIHVSILVCSTTAHLGKIHIKSTRKKATGDNWSATACTFTPKQTNSLWKWWWMKWSLHITCSIIWINFNISLFFSSFIYYDALHPRWFLGWYSKPLQTTPPHSNRKHVSLSDTYCFQAHITCHYNNFKSDTAIILVWSVHTIMHAISKRNIYCTLSLACL